jgi:hypothetical protein
VVTLSNFVRTPDVFAVAPAKPTIAFVAPPVSPPNAAPDLMIKTIWPMFCNAVLGAGLLIVGAKPAVLRIDRASPAGVTLTGFFVDDLAAIYRRTRRIVRPIRAGGGARIKIIETAARGKSVVSMVFGSSDLEFRYDESILLRDDPATFATGCVQLLNDAALSRKLGAAANDSASSVTATPPCSRVQSGASPWRFPSFIPRGSPKPARQSPTSKQQ